MTDSLSAPKTQNDILQLLASAPGASEQARQETATREQSLTKPPGALGRLEEVSSWLAAWQGKAPPTVDAPAVIVFAGNHGVAARGVSAYPAEVTIQMVANFEAGGAAVNQLSKAAGATFAIAAIDLETPTDDFTQGPAMTDSTFIDAFTRGWQAVPDDADLIAVGEMGIANTTSAAALCHALFGGVPEDWTGPGTGVSGDALTLKAHVVGEAVSLHRDESKGPIDLLRRLGGKELAAIAGAVLCARHKRIPVLIDGYVAAAAAAPLEIAHPGALDHTLSGHVSAEPGHHRLLAALAKPPLLDLGMRLGEASGAALAINIVRSAAACHAGMATFAEAGVTDKE